MRRLINESNAVAIAHNFDRKEKEEQHVVIVDFGGGKLDVSLMTVDDGVVEVKAVAGDNYLGGEDFDDKILEYCCEQFLE